MPPVNTLTKGVYITFEGIEGCGKSTQAMQLNHRLLNEGIRTMTTRQPGGTHVGQRIRDILLDPTEEIDPITESLLFWADRRQHHVVFVRPHLEQGYVVLGDRDYDSSWGYQVYGRGIPAEAFMRPVQQAVIGGFKPDCTFLYDLPVDIALRRARRRIAETQDRQTRFEDEEVDFHHRVREGFLELAIREPERFVVLDGTKSPEALNEETYIAAMRVIRKYETPVARP